MGIYDVAAYELGFEKELIIKYDNNSNKNLRLSDLYISSEKHILINKLTYFSREEKIKIIIKNMNHEFTNKN